MNMFHMFSDFSAHAEHVALWRRAWKGDELMPDTRKKNTNIIYLIVDSL